jgi:hypothetical protein
MNHIIDSDVPVEQAPMCIIIIVLPVEKEAAATLRVHIPKQNAESATGEVTGQVYGCSGLTYATLDIIYSNLFQNLKLITKQ